jgi:predicted SnoaL-like aldol condensation-catalyzing enzyme
MNNDNLKEAAMAFLRLASSGDVEKAYDHYVARDFKHHNPYYKGDKASLRKGMEESARTHPNKEFEILMVIQEENTVVVFSRVQPSNSKWPVAVVHIMRFTDGLISELWDVIMPQPHKVINEQGIFL